MLFKTSRIFNKFQGITLFKRSQIKGEFKRILNNDLSIFRVIML